MRLEVALPDYEAAQLIYWLGYTQAAPLLRSKFLHPSSGSCEPNYREERWLMGLRMAVSRGCCCPLALRVEWQAAARWVSKQRGAHVSCLPAVNTANEAPPRRWKVALEPRFLSCKCSLSARASSPPSLLAGSAPSSACFYPTHTLL